MKAIYPGTFDPPTLGHLDIAKRALKIFGHLIIAVGTNPQKKESIFSPEDRVQMWKKILPLPQVEVFAFKGLLVDFVLEHQASVIVRSLRNNLDFEQEILQEQINHLLSGIETIYLTADAKYRMISSTLIKEIGKYGKHLDVFIPKEIESQVYNLLKK